MTQRPAGRSTSRRRRPQPARPRSISHCLKVIRLLSSYLDGDLPPTVCEEIREHLGSCPNCETFVGSMRQTLLLCRHTTPACLSDDAKADLRRRILRAVS